MIFSAIYRFFKIVIDGIARITAFLLIRLWLWLPAVFSLLFIVVCALTRIKLDGTAKYIFITGLVICFAASIYFFARQYERERSQGRSNKRTARVNILKTDKAEYVEENSQKFIQPPIEQKVPRAFKEREDEPAQEVNETREAPKRTAKYEDFADLKKKYLAQIEEDEKKDIKSSIFGENPDMKRNDRFQTQENALDKTHDERNPDSSLGYERQIPQSDILHKDRLERRLSGKKAEETPMIFASRRDSSILIYEYSDRLQFFKKTRKGLELISTEYKD